MSVGGARVIGRSSGHAAPMSRYDACVAHPVSAREGGTSSQSIATGGSSVFPLSAFPVFPEYDSGNVYRTVLYGDSGPSRGASSSGRSGSGESSIGVGGALHGSVKNVYPVSFIPRSS